MNNKIFYKAFLISIALLISACGEKGSFKLKESLRSQIDDGSEVLTEEEINRLKKSDLLPDRDLTEEEANQNLMLSEDELKSEFEYELMLENKFLNIVTVQNLNSKPRLRSYGRYNDVNGTLKSLSGFRVYREREVSIDKGITGYYRHLITISDQNSVKKLKTCPGGMQRNVYWFSPTPITICSKIIQGRLTASLQKASNKINSYVPMTNSSLEHFYSSASFIGVISNRPATPQNTDPSTGQPIEPVKEGCFQRGSQYFYTNGGARCEVDFNHFLWSCRSKTSVSNAQYARLANHGTCRPRRSPRPGCFTYQNRKYYTNGGARCLLRPGNVCDRKTWVSKMQFDHLANHGTCK